MAQAVGFFTDITVCIGCKACQVACHQWNDLPAWEDRPDGRMSLPVLSGDSYDNTRSLSAVNWRHVKFIEQFSPDASRSEAAWLMMSDVCKHCVHAPCLEVCPTGAIVRTEFDTVYIQEPVCNGCRDCVAACPFGVIYMSETRGIAQKCTFCYDRLKQGLPPACAQSCPTESIRFGPLHQLQQQAHQRPAFLSWRARRKRRQRDRWGFRIADFGLRIHCPLSSVLCPLRPLSPVPCLLSPLLRRPGPSRPAAAAAGLRTRARRPP